MKHLHFTGRLACLLCALLMVLGLAACKGTGDPEASGTSQTDPGSGNNTGTPSETDKWGQEIQTPGLPEDLYYGNGETMTIVTRPRTVWTREWGVESPSDNLGYQIYARNMAVETQLGVELKFVKRDEFTSNALSDYVYASYLADLGEMDVVCGSAYYQTAAAIKTCFTNLHDSSKVKYMDLDKIYWNQSYIDAATLYDNLYYIVGDVNLSAWDRMLVLFANVNQLEEIGESNIMDTVLDGNWTFEAMLELIKKKPYTEIDGLEGPTDGDGYAFYSYFVSQALDGFQTAFDLHLLTKEEDGSLALNITGNQKLSDAATLVYNFYHDNEEVHGMSNANDATMVAFVEGRAMFEVNCLYGEPSVHSSLRDMTDTYVVLPLPMYDSQQEEYFTTLQDTYNLMSIMDCSSTDQAMVSAVLALMCYKSYENVRPYYLEKHIKGVYLKEAQNVQIMELILDSVEFDPAVIYSSQLENLRNATWRPAAQKGSSIFTLYESIEESVVGALDEMLTWYMTS